MRIAVYAMVFVVVMAIIIVVSIGCAQLPNEATGARYLHNLGYDNVTYVSRSPFAEIHGCSKDDVVVLKYKARNPRNQPVTVEVCQGWPFSGAHMRGQ